MNIIYFILTFKLTFHTTAVFFFFFFTSNPLEKQVQIFHAKAGLQFQHDAPGYWS